MKREGRRGCSFLGLLSAPSPSTSCKRPTFTFRVGLEDNGAGRTVLREMPSGTWSGAPGPFAYMISFSPRRGPAGRGRLGWLCFLDKEQVAKLGQASW